MVRPRADARANVRADARGPGCDLWRTTLVAAEQPGAVLLDANQASRVFEVASDAVLELIGLNITGGLADTVRPRQGSLLGTRFLSTLPVLQRPLN